jgi:hypothetical protein
MARPRKGEERPKPPAKVHMRDTRLLVNAGMRFPLCYASAIRLDTDKSGLPTTHKVEEVTCGRCLAMVEKGAR